jgi:hypothetical protein
VFLHAGQLILETWLGRGEKLQPPRVQWRLEPQEDGLDVTTVERTCT